MAAGYPGPLVLQAVGGLRTGEPMLPRAGNPLPLRAARTGPRREQGAPVTGAAELTALVVAGPVPGRARPPLRVALDGTLCPGRRRLQAGLAPRGYRARRHLPAAEPARDCSGRGGGRRAARTAPPAEARADGGFPARPGPSWPAW